VRQHIEAVRTPAGYNIGINVGEVAGQTIAHAHLHVIPGTGVTLRIRAAASAALSPPRDCSVHLGKRWQGSHWIEPLIVLSALSAALFIALIIATLLGYQRIANELPDWCRSKIGVPSAIVSRT
jgi:hypothetical protein